MPKAPFIFILNREFIWLMPSSWLLWLDLQGEEERGESRWLFYKEWHDCQLKTQNEYKGILKNVSIINMSPYIYEKEHFHLIQWTAAKQKLCIPYKTAHNAFECHTLYWCPWSTMFHHIFSCFWLNIKKYFHPVISLLQWNKLPLEDVSFGRRYFWMQSNHSNPKHSNPKQGTFQS